MWSVPTRLALSLLMSAALLLGFERHAGAVTCQVGPTTYTVTMSGSGTFSGTPGNDVILGSGGRDVIQGNGGNDVVCPTAGNDDITLGNGADRADNGPGRDTIRGGAVKTRSTAARGRTRWQVRMAATSSLEI